MVCGPSAQLGAALASGAQIRAAIATKGAKKSVTRGTGISLQHLGYPDDSGPQRDLPGELLRRQLKPVIERRQLGPLAIAALEGERDQVIRQPGVLRQQRAMQVGADQVAIAGALEPVLAVVAETLE